MLLISTFTWLKPSLISFLSGATVSSRVFKTESTPPTRLSRSRIKNKINIIAKAANPNPKYATALVKFISSEIFSTGGTGLLNSNFSSKVSLELPCS